MQVLLSLYPCNSRHSVCTCSVGGSVVCSLRLCANVSAVHHCFSQHLMSNGPHIVHVVRDVRVCTSKQLAHGWPIAWVRACVERADGGKTMHTCMHMYNRTLASIHATRYQKYVLHSYIRWHDMGCGSCAQAQACQHLSFLEACFLDKPLSLYVLACRPWLVLLAAPWSYGPHGLACDPSLTHTYCGHSHICEQPVDP